MVVLFVVAGIGVDIVILLVKNVVVVILELDAFRVAVEITDKVYEEILPMLRPGYTEKQVANTLVSKYREYGDGKLILPLLPRDQMAPCRMQFQLIGSLKRVILL